MRAVRRLPEARTPAMGRKLRGLGVRGGAARVVVAGEPEQQPVQRGAAVVVERSEELLLEALDDRAQSVELGPAVAGEADDVAAAIVWVALALDQAAVLQRVE